MASSPSPVLFPVSEPPSPVQHVPHLPFRRISLPAAPSPGLLHRQSIVSLASVDSEGSQFPRRGHRTSTSIESSRKKRLSKAASVRPVDEGKRKKVVDEFVETEKAYVDGLELVYAHFLTPILASLDTPSPILDRPSLTAVFSNFIDIWNLHRAFLASLSSSASSPLSSILTEHFPYLSLYTPFTTSFPTTLSTLASLTTPSSPSYNPTFSAFLATQELDPRCGRLKLRDWLLTIIQRCPRYLLLLKDLIACTDPDHPEYPELMTVHGLVTKITATLNTSLHTHAQTLSLLALQRATPNLPTSLQFISPGRTLLKREPLWMLDNAAGGGSACREFLLFSDCLVWLEDHEGSGLALNFGWGKEPTTPTRMRTRSDVAARSSPSNGFAPRTSYHPPTSATPGRQDEKKSWIYRGHVGLVDVEVVGGVDVDPGVANHSDWKFEVLSPQGSFVLFADSASSRTSWTNSIRSAKSELLVSLGKTRPHSTLATSAGKGHVRRSVRAVAFLPADDEEDDQAEVEKGAASPRGVATRSPRRKRRSVEHFVPAVWMPDDRVSGCVLCGKAFGWTRRRHHCRLCGGVVCAGCSGKTFYISETEFDIDNGHENATNRPARMSPRKEKARPKQKYKPARACETCYETVFPVVEDPHPSSSPVKPCFSATSDSAIWDRNSGMNGGEDEGSTEWEEKDRISSLRDLPMWVSVSVPSSPGWAAGTSKDGAVSLMKVGPGAAAERRGRRGSGSGVAYGHGYPGTSARPRSYMEIVKDLQDGGDDDAVFEDVEGDDELVSVASLSPPSQWGTKISAPNLMVPRENTAKKVKRFSLPAGVALQRTSVSVFSGREEEEDDDPFGGGGGVGTAVNAEVLVGREREGGDGEDEQKRSRKTSLVGAMAAGRRFSLVVLGGRGQVVQDGVGESPSGLGGEEQRTRRKEAGLGKGIAASKLSELLGRKRDHL